MKPAVELSELGTFAVILHFSMLKNFPLHILISEFDYR